MLAIHRSSFATVAAIALACFPAPAQTQPVSVVFAHTLPKPHDIGWSALGLGDLDGDGHDEYALGAPRDGGSVLFMSGRTGLPIRTISGWQSSDRFGQTMARIHDVDGDKVPDLLVGAPNWNSSSGRYAGRVAVLSVKTGKILATIDGTTAYDKMGFTIAAAGDTNKDGVPDYMVATYGYPNNTEWGRVQVFSGKDHKTVLRTYTGNGAKDRFGQGMCGVGDLDNDGYDDIAICGTNHTKVYSSRFGIQLKSFSFGNILARIGDIDGDQKDDLLISALSSRRVYGYTLPGFKQVFVLSYWAPTLLALPDVDKDGVRDFAVADWGADAQYFNAGKIWILSGKTRKVLYVMWGTRQDGQLGRGVGAADVTGDGNAELIGGQPGAGQVARVYHLGKLPFTASRHWVSLANGGTINFTIDGGTSRAGLMYMVAGSITGYKPGFDMWGVHIPLNPDPYFYITIGYPNNPFLSNSLGILDSAGKAVCTLKIPPNLKSKWTGITLDHAAVVFCKSPPMPCFIHLATNARPVTTVQ